MASVGKGDITLDAAAGIAPDATDGIAPDATDGIPPEATDGIPPDATDGVTSATVRDIGDDVGCDADVAP